MLPSRPTDNRRKHSNTSYLQLLQLFLHLMKQEDHWITQLILRHEKHLHITTTKKKI